MKSSAAKAIRMVPKPLEEKSKAFECASAILDIDHWVPEKRVTSEELENLLKEEYRKPGFLEKVIGVKEHRVSDGLALSEMAAIPSKNIMNRCGVDPSSIDLVIFSGVSKEVVEPATANLVARRVGANAATCFDVSSACLGFVDALLVADAMIAAKRVRAALVVTAERADQTIQKAIAAINNGGDFGQLFAAMSLGDGAAAALLVPTHHPRAKLRMLSAIRESYSEYNDACVLDNLQEAMMTDTKKLFNSSLTHLPPLFQELMELAELDPKNIDLIVPHQASLSIAEKGVGLLGCDIEKIAFSLSKYGNMASASVPITLSESLVNGKCKSGGHAVILGFGSGLGIGLINLKVNI